MPEVSWVAVSERAVHVGVSVLLRDGNRTYNMRKYLRRRFGSR